MTDEKFTELVNLYFDKEISVEELEELKFEISACPERKRAFAERCQLDKAMRIALEPAKSGGSKGSQARSDRPRRYSSGSFARNLPHEKSARMSNEASFPRWMLASGLAASVAIGMFLLPPVFRDTTDWRARPELVSGSGKNVMEEDPLANLRKSELRRYAVLQQRGRAKRHASLVAQMRLMGLRPELTPENKNLRDVSMAAVHEPRQGVSRGEIFQRIQGSKVLPQQQLLRLDDVDLQSGNPWPSNYKSSFVGFEKL